MEPEHYSIHVPLIDNDDGPPMNPNLNRDNWNWTVTTTNTTGVPLTVSPAPLVLNPARPFLDIREYSQELNVGTPELPLTIFPAVAILETGEFVPILREALPLTVTALSQELNPFLRNHAIVQVLMCESVSRRNNSVIELCRRWDIPIRWLRHSRRPPFPMPHEVIPEDFVNRAD